MPERNKGYIDSWCLDTTIRLSIITIVLWLKTILRTLDHTLSLGILAALKIMCYGGSTTSSITGAKWADLLHQALMAMVLTSRPQWWRWWL